MQSRKEKDSLQRRDANNQSASGNDPGTKKFLGSKAGSLKDDAEKIEEEQRVIDQLSVFEKKFLLCSERGDTPAVRQLIEKHKNNPRFNINCRDAVGRSALIVAIENENMELIDVLLNNGIQAGDSLLHAISEEYVEAVEVLLQHEEKTYVPGKPYSWEAVDHDMAIFTKDITPLILAAHRDNYEIIKLLLDRGASLPMPHDIRCGCDECELAVRDDCLRHSRSRINAYRALTSPSLICLSSTDPIFTAFGLSRDLAKLSSDEHEFRLDYVELRNKCEEYATALLDHTRTSYELEVMLNYDPNGPAYVKGERMKLERLKLAIISNQKSFVAHPNVQQLLGSVWYAGSPGFRKKNIVGQLMDIAKMGIMCPVYSTAYMLAPESALGQNMKKPFTKFITHSTAYCFFLLLLIAASQRVETLLIEFIEDYMEWKDPNELPKSDRGAIPGFVESVIIIFIFGFVWAEIKQLWDGGLEEYVRDMWNVVDYFTNMLYVTFIALRISSWYIVQREISEGHMPTHMREYWHPYDPTLIAEGVFGAANIFSFLKMVHIFSVNPHLGPLQISLGRMVFDIIKFFFIYTLVLFAFGCGMNQLLWYYADIDKHICYSLPNKPDIPNPNFEQQCLIWRRFANLFETSQSLFWASFGLVELENFELTGIKSFTRFWSLLMFGSYSVINVVVLLNLLIAMMSNSYQIISERSDAEWKFARSKLWMSYFEDGSTVPPPFNIIPTPKFFRKMLTCKTEKESASIKVKEAVKRDAEYRSVMRCLIRRYVTTQQRKQEDMGVTEDDVNEVKQAVTSFRSELFDILRNNDFKGVTSTADTLSRKERLRERRLLKDFNIDLVESVMEAFMKDQTHSSSNRFSLIRRMTGKRGNAKKHWNQIVGAARSKQNPIGMTGGQSGSLKELRDKVLREQELPPMKGVRRFAHAARRVLEGKYTEPETIQEEGPGSYSASATPRSSITPQEESKQKSPRRKPAEKEPTTSTSKERKKIETTPKKEVPKEKKESTAKEQKKAETTPKKEAPKKSTEAGKEPTTKKMETTPKKTLPKTSESGKEPTAKKMETTPKTTPKKTVPKKTTDTAAKAESGKEPTAKTTPKKAPKRPEAGKEPSAKKMETTPKKKKPEAGKEPTAKKMETTPKKTLPKKPTDPAAKIEAGKESTGKKMETTPKKVMPRKPADAKAEPGKEPSTSTTKEPKKMETSPKKIIKKPIESAAKAEPGKQPTPSVIKDTKKFEPTVKRDAPKKPPDTTVAEVEVGKVSKVKAALEEKQKSPIASADKGMKKPPAPITDEALRRRKSTDVVLDIETDTSLKPKPSPSRSPVKVIEMPSDSKSGVKGLITAFDDKGGSSKKDQGPSLPKSPAKKPSAKIFPTDSADDTTTWI